MIGGVFCVVRMVSSLRMASSCVFYKLGCVYSRLEGVVGSDEW